MTTDHTFSTTSRSSGILLHPTSLPGKYGTGEIGAEAFDFVKKLSSAKQRWWQMLPINTPGYAGSPYSAESAFAGNTALISTDALLEQELVTTTEVQALVNATQNHDPRRVNFSEVLPAKQQLLDVAAQRFIDQDKHTSDAFKAFTQKHAHWLDDYALYASLKQHHEGKGWRQWPAALVARDEAAIADAKRELAELILKEEVLQFIFFSQWQELLDFAHKHDVALIGDIPIFVAMDSADVWVNRHLFKLDAQGNSEVVAGVPPDYFSETGQKWGNPVYDWKANKEEGYAWWLRRIQHAMLTMDLVRIDHFRGFQAYWETPTDEPTAIHGKWVDGPAHDFFDTIQRELGHVPFIAEDLGDIDDAVIELRDAYELPGMKIMQFAFGDEQEDHPFRPHTYPACCVAYTGTHDNNTTQGWFDELGELEKHRVRTYLSCPDELVVERLFETLFESNAALVMLPAQDLWKLGSEHRMNTPATTEGNWSWRMTSDELADQTRFNQLANLTQTHNRSK